MELALYGATCVANFIAAMFFFQFWRKTKDRFFGFFSLAFVLLALNRLLLIIQPGAGEREALIYAVRLIAFVVILIAIVDKNRTAARGS